MRLLSVVLVALIAIIYSVSDLHWFDRRPVERLLFIGHSYTYYNDMPAMVGEIADSAGSPVRYDITMSAFPNAKLAEHWRYPKTQRLLTQGGWDRIVAQPEGSFRPLGTDSEMYVYGRKLLVGTAKQPPALIISHRATDTFYETHYSISRSEDGELDQENVRGLASETGAEVIDINRVWENVRAGDLPFSLYSDGNHPSVQGSYLIALVVYAALSKSNVANVSYVPRGMTEAEGTLLRDRVRAVLGG